MAPRRICPIPVNAAPVQDQPITSIAVASSTIEPAEKLEPVPGRRMHVDINNNNAVSYQEVYKRSINSSRAREKAVAPSQTTAPDGLPTAILPGTSPGMGRGSRREILGDLVERLERQLLTGHNISDDDYDNEDEDEEDSEGEGDEGEESEGGAEEENPEGDNNGVVGGNSSEGDESDSSSEDDGDEVDLVSSESGSGTLSDGDDEEAKGAAAGAGSGGGGEGKDGEKQAGGGGGGGGDTTAPGTTTAPTAVTGKPPRPRPARVRQVRYEEDFIDDTEIVQIQPGAVRAVVDGFFINKGDVQINQVAPVAQPAPIRRRAAKPSPAQTTDATAAQVPANVAQGKDTGGTASSIISAAAATIRKRIRDTTDDVPGDKLEKKAPSGQRRATQPAVKAPATTATTANPTSTAQTQPATPKPDATPVVTITTATAVPARPLTIAQMAIKAGQAAIGTSGPSRATKQSSPAPADSDTSRKDMPPPSHVPPPSTTPDVQPVPGGTDQQDGPSQAQPTGASTGLVTKRQGRVKRSAGQVVAAIKAKLDQALSSPPAGQATQMDVDGAPAPAASPQLLKLKDLKEQLKQLGLACYAEASGDALWRDDVTSKVTELMSDGRAAALPGQDIDSVLREVTRIVDEQVKQVDQLTSDMLTIMKMAVTDTAPGSTPVLNSVGCATLVKLLDQSRKLSIRDPQALRAAVINGLVASEGMQPTWTVAAIEAQYNAHVIAGKAGKGGSGSSTQADAPTTQPAPVSPAPARQRKAAVPPSSPQEAQPPAPAVVAIGERLPSSAPSTLVPSTGAGDGPASQGTASQEQGNVTIKFTAEQEAALLRTALEEGCKRGVDETLFKQDWDRLPRPLMKAILTALCFYDHEGATTRQINDTIVQHQLIPGWHDEKACFDKVIRTVTSKKMDEVLSQCNPQGRARHAWRHLPGVVAQPRKPRKASDKGKGSGHGAGSAQEGDGVGATQMPEQEEGSMSP